MPKKRVEDNFFFFYNLLVNQLRLVYHLLFSLGIYYSFSFSEIRNLPIVLWKRDFVAALFSRREIASRVSYTLFNYYRFKIFLLLRFGDNQFGINCSFDSNDQDMIFAENALSAGP